MPGFAAFASHAPSRIVRNDQLPVPFDNVEAKTGIRSRRIAEGETIASMGVDVAFQLCETLGIRVADCGGLVLSTCALDPEHQVKELCKAAGFPVDRPVIGLNDACTGFISTVRAGVKLAKETDREILVIASEKLSDITDYGDPQTGLLFGDWAAGAVIARDGRHTILDVFSRAVDQPNILGVEELSAARDIDGRERRRTCIRMPGGRKLYKTVPRTLVELMDEGIVSYNRRIGPYQREWALSRENISHVYPHQANGNIVEAIKKVMERTLWPKPLPSVENRILDMGNVGSASIPAILAAALRYSFADDRIVTCPAVGAGPGLCSDKLTEGNLLIALNGHEARPGEI